MKLHKEVRKSIEGHFETIPHMEKNQLVELLKQYADLPDVEKLIEQEYGRTADRLIASYRDANNQRKYLALKKPGILTEYIDIDNTEDINSLIALEQQASRQYEGLNATREKIIYRKELLAGQQRLDEAEEEEKQANDT